MNLTATAALAVIAAALAPFVTAIINKPGMAPTTKRLIAGGVATVLGTLTAVVSGQLPFLDNAVVGGVTTALVSVGMVMSLGQGFFKQFQGAVYKLEGATSPGEEPEPDDSRPDVERPDLDTDSETDVGEPEPYKGPIEQEIAEPSKEVF